MMPESGQEYCAGWKRPQEYNNMKINWINVCLTYTLCAYALFIIAGPCAAIEAVLQGSAQQTVTVEPFMAVLRTDPKTVVAGKPATLDVLVMDASSMAPSQGLSIAASLSMPAISRAERTMDLDPPKVTPGDAPGHYTVHVTFPRAGEYKLGLKVTSSTGKFSALPFKVTPGSTEGRAMNRKPGMEEMQAKKPMQGMPRMEGAQGKQAMQGMPGMEGTKDKQAKQRLHNMHGMQMKAILGDWAADREGSGTSWQPDSTPMFMKLLGSPGGFDFGTMGIIQGGYDNAGGKRGGKGLFSSSMIMLMGRKDVGGGAFGLHFMTSLDPIINGRRGVPNLFQNAFDVNGATIGDRKDPHNLFAELAVSYSHALSKDWSGFIYGGPVGEPALGNVMYLHRTSGLEIPEAPISHDWFDGSHISFGVATLGIVYKNKWKLEGSGFNSDEPGAHLYGIGRIALNSASGRLSYNPSRDWSFSTSYGYLKSDVNEHRLTLSASYSHDLPRGDNLSVTAYFGQNIATGTTASNAWLAEATYYHSREAFFARFERVDKAELVEVPPGNYTINKLLVGDVHNFYSKNQFDYGLGAYVGLYSFPSSLNAFYGKSPITFGLFLRIRPSKQ